MQYQEFLSTTKRGEHIPNYYSELLKHTPDILIDIAMRNQNRVAKDLGMTSVKFSHLLPMLKELYRRLQDGDDLIKDLTKDQPTDGQPTNAKDS